MAPNTPQTVQFAYGNIDTRRITLNTMVEPRSDKDERERRIDEYLAKVFDGILDKVVHATREIPMSPAEEIMAALDKKGGAFQHTREYYAAIEAETERMKAYQHIIVTGAVAEDEEKIIRDPLPFLGLEKGATFGQIRAAWRQQARLWHEDMMRPDDRPRLFMIFGTTEGNFPVTGITPEEWIDKILSSGPPVILELEEVEAMSDIERQEYETVHLEYRQKEAEYKAVKDEMIRRAHEKIVTLNLAYKSACRPFSRKEIESFAGFNWQKGSRSGLDGMFGFDFEYISLESGAELRRKYKLSWTDDGTSVFEGDDVSLHFDNGEIYMGDQNDCRQSIDLQTLFAWIELSQLQELTPFLLNGIAKACELDQSQREQLRLMLMNREDIQFILDAIPLKKDMKWKLYHFISTLYFGPNYGYQVGIREDANYPLGVELQPEGGMILRYHNQRAPGYSGASYADQVQITPVDMNVMRSMAYGPLLAVEE